ncbi:hypothetical protein BZA77DRAFT_90758 [Pyronema omphalodes]|nr:hypothetical protein BZA77DRAFT_90758 [Pyronema omphalodes]
MAGQLTFLILTTLSTMASCLPTLEKRNPMNGNKLQWYQIKSTAIYDGYTQIALYGYQGWRWDGSANYPRIHLYSHIRDEADRCKKIPEFMRDKTVSYIIENGCCAFYEQNNCSQMLWTAKNKKEWAVDQNLQNKARSYRCNYKDCN